MAKLYDVYYFGSSYDSARPLPEPRDDIAYVRNVNADGEYMIPRGNQWVEVSRQEATQRAGHGDPAPARIIPGRTGRPL